MPKLIGGKPMHFIVSTVVLAGVLIPVIASASGFGIFTQGASALGQADAVVAHGEDPSAIFFNPALITKLTGNRVQIGTTYINASREYQGTTKTSSSADYFPSTFYATSKVNENVSIGLGVFNPFGLGTKWKSGWEGRYLATTSNITTYTFNPVISLRILPNFSIAAGANYLLLDAELNRNINLSGFGLPDARQKFTGEGDGWGCNFAVAANVTDRLSVGASYRSRIHVGIKGDVAFKRPAPAVEAVLPDTKARSSMLLPQQLFGGVSYRFTDRFTAEAGFRWEDWSSFDQLKLRFNTPVAGQTFVTEKKQWHDTFGYNVGGSYILNDNITLLAGYLHGENAVPAATFEPAVPDSDTHLFCVGTEFNHGKSTIAIGYGYQLQDDRRKNNEIGDGLVNGKYSSSLHLLGMSVSYGF